MLGWLAQTWNSIELWITQQSFWLQFVIVMAVLLPLCLVAAWLIDRVVDYVSARVGPGHKSERPIEGGADDEGAATRQPQAS